MVLIPFGVYLVTRIASYGVIRLINAHANASWLFQGVLGVGARSAQTGDKADNAKPLIDMMKDTRRSAENSVTESSGNAFADLGFKDADAYLAKSALAIHIHRVIKKRGLTQDEAGQILGINQPKVSAIIKGRLDGSRLSGCSASSISWAVT
jgi:predicted XRE-type DNA-binding protein